MLNNPPYSCLNIFFEKSERASRVGGGRGGPAGSRGLGERGVFRGAVCCGLGRRDSGADGVRGGYERAGPAKGTNNVIREPDGSL